MPSGDCPYPGTGRLALRKLFTLGLGEGKSEPVGLEPIDKLAYGFVGAPLAVGVPKGEGVNDGAVGFCI